MYLKEDDNHHKNIRLHFIITTILQLFVFIYFLPGFYKINNVSATFVDYLYFCTYTYFFLIILKTILYGPFGIINYFLKSKFISFLALFIDLGLIALFVLDCLIYNYQGMHVYDKMVVKLLLKNQGFERIEIGWFSIITFIFATIAVTLFATLIYKFTKKINLNKKKFLASELVISLIIVSIFSFNFPKYFNANADVINIFPFLVLAKKRPSNEKLSINYDQAVSKDIIITKKPNILFLFIESLRDRSFNKETAPRLFDYFSKNNCINPQDHFSGGHTTVYGTFTALYGLHGFHYADFKNKKIQSTGLKILKENGYKLFAGFSGVSNFSSYYNAGFMFNIFDEFREFINAKDPNQSDIEMYNWSNQLNPEGAPYFKFLFYYSTHANYYYPKKFDVFSPTLKRNYSHLDSSFSPKDFQIGTLNRYKNSIRFMDDLLMNQIEKLDPNEETIIILTGDHGQVFGEEGVYGHAKTNYINPLIKVPLYICTPQKKNVVSHFSGHINIMPSLINLVSEDEQYESLKKSFNGLSIFKEQNKYLTVVAPLFPYRRNKISLMTPNMKFWLKKINNTMDSFYPYRAATLKDEPIFGEKQRVEYEKALKLFQAEAYKFLQKQSDKTPINQ